jgi:hypothetical protein
MLSRQRGPKPLVDPAAWSRARKRSPHRRRRERMAHFGELLQLDGSFHPWLYFCRISASTRPRRFVSVARFDRRPALRCFRPFGPSLRYRR